MSDRPECVLGDDVLEATPAEPPDGAEDLPQIGSDELSLVEILRVVFDMGIGEREVYAALNEQEYSSAGNLAEELDRDRSNINRALTRLCQHGFITRRRRILQSGGHLYQYSVRPPEEVRRLLLYGVRQWARAACDEVEVFVGEQGSKPPQNGASDATEPVHQ